MATPTMVGPAVGDRQHDRAADRAQALETLWRESGLPSVQCCGRVALAGGGGLVAVKASGLAGKGRTAGFGGLQTCGSTWACPECSAKIANTRKAELEEAQAEARRRGWTIAHVTLTMRHYAGQALCDLWGAVSYAWGAATSGAAWQTEKKTFGVRGWVRIVEVTHGVNGWHVHVHALLFTDAEGFGRSPEHLAPAMFQRWAKALKRKTLKAPSANSGGLSVRVLGGTENLADYFTKTVYVSAEEAKDLAALANEAARGMQKDARHGNRTPFAILADVVEHGEARDLGLWHEWERGSKGRRQMTWSRGLRAELVTIAELTDEEIAEQDLGGEVLVLLPADTWKAVTEEWGARTTLRNMACVDDTGQGLRAYLRARGWAWVEPTPAAPVDVERLAAKRAAP